MELKACIFDLDGVVVDTAKYHYRAWKRLARQLGFDFTPDQNESLKGVSRMQSLDIVLRIGGYRCGEEEKRRLAELKNSWYVQYISRMTPAEILPGVCHFINEARAAGIGTALASASRNAGTILRGVGLERFFDAVVDGTMVSAAKPDPAIFLLAARLLGVEPERCVVFEDAAAGVEAARRRNAFRRYRYAFGALGRRHRRAWSCRFLSSGARLVGGCMSTGAAVLCPGALCITVSACIVIVHERPVAG